MATLEHAIVIAAQAHAGQKDKAGMPYILHPLRVMLAQRDDSARIAAVLHDVVEDTGWTLERLAAEGFDETIVAAVDAVTRRPDEPYEDFVRRAIRNPIGRAVKKADLQDNLDSSRIAHPSKKDDERMEKYRRALRLINEAER